MSVQIYVYKNTCVTNMYNIYHYIIIDLNISHKGSMQACMICIHKLLDKSRVRKSDKCDTSTR